MYLLNLFSRLFKSITVDKFTFHYVSIKSVIIIKFEFNIYRFTFHYVSIKSVIIIKFEFNIYRFTFHYVSIKSKIINAVAHEVIRFTFHYVSIKSSSLPVLLFLFRNLHSTIYLLNRAGDFRHSPL